MMMTKTERRPAKESDEVFMCKLHKAANHDVVVRQFGEWNDELQVSLFAKKWQSDPFEILEIDGQPIGCIRIEDRPDEVFFAEIQILPEFQGQGIGSQLIQTEITRASKLKKPIRLQVLQKNERARKLYEQLGFTMYGTTDRHFLLQIIPNS
jgi:ribosomal protein S18 acetylase RimI-like enzyme